ncbi:MAG: cysteine desulfurase NifS [Euryarchaeota archaeon RBG_16_62_10]|nr:MAG: cysteine desulfurase NifS [Euryarchaeota archaeon RBG_16_62_10]
MISSQRRRVYFDHSATTGVLPEVVEAMEPYFTERFGNASSIHSQGRDARAGLEDARKEVADLLNADPQEIVFTSGGTESDNLAVKGVATYKGKSKGHIITTVIEHHAILETCEFLKRYGIETTYLPVSHDGLLDPGAVERAIRNDTVLITVMTANNEIGTIQPIREIGAIARSRGIPFHTDAVQAIGKMQVDVKADNIDLLSLSAHKFHGPKGVGALYVRRGTKIEPIIHGGGQERGLRSSTQNVAGAVGLGRAATMAKRDLGQATERMRAIRDQLLMKVPETVPNSYVNGHLTRRLVNNAHFRFDFIEGESLVLQLDFKGIATSTGSACSTGSLEPSHVLLALGLTHEQAHGSLRVTLGRENTQEEADYLLEVLPEVVSKLRAISPFSAERPMGPGEGGGCVQ